MTKMPNMSKRVIHLQAKADKYRVRATRDLLGYVYAHSSHEAWTKASIKWGMLVQTVEML